MIARGHGRALAQAEHAPALQINEQVGERVMGFQTVALVQGFGEQFEHERVAADGHADFLEERIFARVMAGVTRAKELQGLGLGQARDFVGRGGAKLGHARGEQHVKIRATAQVQIIRGEVVQFIRVVNHEQAWAGQARHGREQTLAAALGGQRVFKAHAQRSGETEHSRGDVVLAQHPREVFVFFLMGMKIARGQRGFADAAFAIDQEQQARAGKELVFQVVQLGLAANEALGQKRRRGEQVRNGLRPFEVDEALVRELVELIVKMLAQAFDVFVHGLKMAELFEFFLKGAQADEVIQIGAASGERRIFKIGEDARLAGRLKLSQRSLKLFRGIFPHFGAEQHHKNIAAANGLVVLLLQARG